MDRRDFIKVAAAGAAGMAVCPGASAQDMVAGVVLPGDFSSDGRRGNVSNGAERHVNVSGYVREQAHRIPVAASADVVVVGGGPAGVAAAVCAARLGASAILIEKANFLGGLWTGGLVLPVLANFGKGKKAAWEKATGGFCSEICDKLLSTGGAFREDDPIVEPEETKYLLDKTILEAGVRMVYNATAAGVVMSGNRIDCVLIDCNTGRLAIKCKAAIDASGDGCLFNFAGDPHEDRLYHMSTSFRVTGTTSGKAGAPTPIDNMKFRTVGTREVMDGLDIFKVSELQQKHRLQVWDLVQNLKKDPECKDAYLMEVAPVTGVRVTRVLDSLHNVTLEDSMEWAAYPDVIGMAGVCDPFDYKGRRIERKDRPIWQIPYRSLIPKETQNLLVCGRCFGYDQGITWDAREISTCMVTGQAAGTAAAMAVAGRCAAKDVDIDKLQATLRAGKVRLDF